MPRAFLITNKRYKSAVDYEENEFSRDSSPERGVSTGDLPSETDVEPHSPAHEYRSAQNSPSSDSYGNTMYRPIERSTSPPTTYTVDAPVFRPFHQSALVTVIRQIMEQQQQQQGHFHDNNNTESHVCSECGKRYSTSSNLARHRQTHRSMSDKKARKCPHCDKLYVSMPAFSMHVRTHSQGCRCPYCGKCFSRPWLLQGHIRTHTGEKPFQCPVCRKAFADKSNLRAHVQTHSTSKPYICGRCGKAFALKSYLYKHEESSCMRMHRQQKEPVDLVTSVKETTQFVEMISAAN